MRIVAIIDDIQATQQRLNALHGLMDMGEAVSAQQPQEPRWDYLNHVAQLVHSMVDDIQLHMNEAADELLAEMARERQEA